MFGISARRTREIKTSGAGNGERGRLARSGGEVIGRTRKLVLCLSEVWSFSGTKSAATRSFKNIAGRVSF